MVMEFEEGMLVAYKNDDNDWCICLVDCDPDENGYFFLTEVYPSETGSNYGNVSREELVFLAQNFANQKGDIISELLWNVVLALCRRINRLKKGISS